MLERNTYWVYSSFVTGPVIAMLLFVWAPRRSINPNEIVTILFAGGLASFAIPLVLSWILPAPAVWFPEWFSEYHQTQVEKAIDALR